MHETTADPIAAARRHFEDVDPVLFAATRDLPPLSATRPRDPYAALLRAIVGQQLSVRAASTIWGRVEGHFDGDPQPHRLLAATTEELRALGLSRQKSGYLQNVAAAAVDGALAEQELHALDDDAVIARLTAIKGVGRWTVEMILMFGMCRPDVFSDGDLGIQQAMAGVYGVSLDGRALRTWMRETAAPWSPHRTAACRLLWAWHGAQRDEARRQKG